MRYTVTKDNKAASGYSEYGSSWDLRLSYRNSRKKVATLTDLTYEDMIKKAGAWVDSQKLAYVRFV